MRSRPAPIATAWAEYQAESRPFPRLHRLVDTYETVLKYAAVLAVESFYAADLAGDFPDVDRLVRERITRPMLGQWAELLREVLRGFGQRENALFCRELYIF